MGVTSKTKIAYCESLIDVFIKDYPKCFSRTNKKPLIVGITLELIKKYPAINKRYIKKAAELYIRTLDYYGSYDCFSQRIDLNGFCVAEITNEEKVFAARKIEILKSKLERARIEAEHEALDAEKAKNKRPILTLKRKSITQGE